MAASIGKVFENEMNKVFRLLNAQHLVGWHRLSDSAAAGSLVAEQPSDYLMGLPPGCQNLLDGQRLMFVEVKASEKHHKLGKAMVRPAQRGAISSYRVLLNIPYLILFWDSQLGAIQLWDGAAIYGDSNISNRHILASWENVGAINRLITAKVAAEIAAYFAIPKSSCTLANNPLVSA